MSRMIDDEEALKDNGLIEIDGVNVAECEFRLERDNIQKCECCHATGFKVICDCDMWKDCYYKQLQRLKAGNERLSELTCVNCGEKFLSPTGSELYEENVRLKAENEELKAEIKRLEAPSMIIPNLNQTGVPIEEYLKLKTALEEIWVMATVDVSFASFCKIQTKIAKVLNNVDK